MYNVETNLQAVKHSSQQAASAHETSILAYNGSNITFELSNGEVMVNLTEMAKAFGKRPVEFLRLPSTIELIEAIVRKSHIDEAQVVRTIRGGSNPGTWANRLIALSFAQWLSVDFHLICLEKIEELLTQGVATVSNDDEAILHAMRVLEQRVQASKQRIQTLESEVEHQQAQIKTQAPKVAFANAIITSSTSCLIGELAKLITQNGVSIGQNRLFEWLRENGYLGKKGERYNIPNQQYIEQGLFELKKGVRSGNDGVIHTTITPKVTGKGQAYFINKFLYNEEQTQKGGK